MSGFAAVVLAAGQATRFRAADDSVPTKLVAQLEGEPLVRHTVRAAVAAQARPVVVVTGHAHAAVEAALAGLAVDQVVHNADYATGLASSLRAGIAALPDQVAGAVVLLGDMPMITAGLIDDLIAAARTGPVSDAIVPVVAGLWGNPVLLSARLFPAVAQLAGDAGARHLLRRPGVVVRELALADASIAHDVDEPRDLGRLTRAG